MPGLLKTANISYGNFGRNILLTDDGVLLMDLRGSVTRDALGVVMQQIRAAAAYGSMKAFCVRADRALLMLGSQCMDEIGAHEVMRVSGTLIVNEAARETMETYAQRMARHGILRVVFTSRDEGLAWATRQARMVTAQALWQTAQQATVLRSAVQCAP